MSDTDTEKDDVETTDVEDSSTEGRQDDKDWQSEAEKWKNLARKHEANAKKNAGAADELEQLRDADKTEIQRATDKAAQAEKRASDAEAKLARLEVALDKAPEGMGLARVRKLAGRLTGESREDLESDAEELFAEFVPDTGDEDDSDDTSQRRPKERLRTGAAPRTEPEKNDPASLAADVPRGW